MAGDLIVRAAELGLKPRGISFHVGSQQTDPSQWDDALLETRKLFDRVKVEAGILTSTWSTSAAASRLATTRKSRAVRGNKIKSEAIGSI